MCPREGFPRRPACPVKVVLCPRPKPEVLAWRWGKWWARRKAHLTPNLSCPAYPEAWPVLSFVLGEPPMALCSLGLPGSPGMAEPQVGVRVEGRGTGATASLWPGLAPSASCGPKAGPRLDLDSKSSQATSFWPTGC